MSVPVVCHDSVATYAALRQCRSSPPIDSPWAFEQSRNERFPPPGEDFRREVDSYAVDPVRASKMANDSRMTIRLDPAKRRKVERPAARDGISLNEALNRLLQQAPEQADMAIRRRRCRLTLRKVDFGFEMTQTKQLAVQMSDGRLLSKLNTGLER